MRPKLPSRPPLSHELLLSMAIGGAFWEHGHPFFVDPEAEGLEFLLDNGLVGSLLHVYVNIEIAMTRCLQVFVPTCSV